LLGDGHREFRGRACCWTLGGGRCSGVSRLLSGRPLLAHGQQVLVPFDASKTQPPRLCRKTRGPTQTRVYEKTPRRSCRPASARVKRLGSCRI
jgi:hypothetical protein